MSTNIDILADLNPAYCAAVIFSFCQGFKKESKNDVDFPFLLLPLPILLSGSFNDSFKHTNVNTGFFTWIDRNPHILIELSSRVQGTLDLTQNTIEYGVTHSIFLITEHGKIQCSDEGLKKQLKFKQNSVVKRVCSNGLRLGQWFGQINSPATIFNHLGLEI